MSVMFLYQPVFHLSSGARNIVAGIVAETDAKFTVAQMYAFLFVGSYLSTIIDKCPIFQEKHPVMNHNVASKLNDAF